MPVEPLPPEALCRACDPAAFSFQTTESLEDLAEPPGQDRAREALEFGTGIRRDGYNVFAMGPAETGKKSLVTETLRRRAASEPVPSDLCYLHNFRQPWKPKSLVLPAGRGPALKRDMERLVEDLRTAIPAALEGEEQRARKQVIEEEMKERQEHLFEEVRKEALDHGISVVRTPLGFAFAPVKNGDVMPPEEFEALPPEERRRIEQEIEALQDRLRRTIEQVQSWAREARDRLKALLRDLTTGAVRKPIDDLKAAYADFPRVVEHLTDVQEDIVENVMEFLKPPESPLALPGASLDLGGPSAPPPFRRYLVNVLVDHGSSKGAPVVYEDHPTLPNLLGRSEHVAQMGALVTDLHLIKPGALHKANGGYLLLDAHRLFTQPLAWEALKRALQAREVKTESLGQMMSLISTVSLEPEPFRLDVKVVIFGERWVYHVLDGMDPEFRALFKVAADFDEEIPRTPENDLKTARLVATAVRKGSMRPFDRGAVARVVERRARLAGDSERLSAHLGSLVDLLRESDYWAGVAGRDLVTAEDVVRAVEAEDRRMGRVRERLLDETLRGTLRIETDGERVGEVNGLSVLSMGHYAFGRPTRISCRVRMGKGEVVDVEREVDLSGPIHSKGVMILSGFLSARYAQDHPLSLSATLTFEQSYGAIDGDSASSTELYAILSALADAPIRQGIAVTGSVDQHGRVQPIGGANEKIEGFFDLCSKRGLSGRQGCLIPKANVKHLMLRHDVVEAVRKGRFHVWPVETIDEGIELLTGVPAGERGKDGLFPDGTVNRRAEDRLVAFAKRRIALGAEAGGLGRDKDKEGSP